MHNADRIQLTVYFEDPYWIGLFERRRNGVYSVARHNFGGEPTDLDVYNFVLNNFYDLRFGGDIPEENKPETRLNYKRLLRESRKIMKKEGAGTMAQEAMKRQMETKKVEIKKLSREEREAQNLLKYQMRREKKKEKHKGH